MQRKTCGLTALHLNTLCQCGWASGKSKQYGENSFVGHSQQEYPQFLYENVMSKISSRDGEDFKRPSSVSGSIPSINVSGSQDNNTTNRSTHGGSDTSANSSGTAQSNNNY